MATRPVNLPPGFVLEQQQPLAPNLPQGFVLEDPRSQEQMGAVHRFTKSFNEGTIGTDNPDDITQGMKMAVSHPSTLVDSLTQMGKGAVNGQVNEASKGLQAWNRPGLLNKIDAVGNLINSGMPIIGPMLGRAGEQFVSGDVAGGAGTLTAMTAPLVAAHPATAAVVSRASELVPNAASKLVGKLEPSNLFPGKQAVVYPEAANLPPEAVKAAEGIFQASAPTGLNRNFRSNLYAATPDLAEIGRNIKLDEAKGGLINPDMRVKATVDAIDSHLSDMYKTERAPQIERNAYRPIHNASFGPDAIEGLKYIERTAGTDALRGMATKALEEGVLPLSEADQLAMAVNKNLRSFERMTPAEQAAAGITNRRMGSLDALDSAFGKSINQALKRAGEPGIQGYERRYAALSEISSQLGKRVNAVELNQPGIIKGVLKPVAGALRGGPSGIASASQAAVADVNIGRMLQQSFEQLAATDLTPNRAIRKP